MIRDIAMQKAWVAVGCTAAAAAADDSDDKDGGKRRVTDVVGSSGAFQVGVAVAKVAGSVVQVVAVAVAVAGAVSLDPSSILLLWLL
jgi:hypothetical protein